MHMNGFLDDGGTLHHGTEVYAVNLLIVKSLLESNQVLY